MTEPVYIRTIRNGTVTEREIVAGGVSSSLTREGCSELVGDLLPSIVSEKDIILINGVEITYSQAIELAMTAISTLRWS